MNIFPKVKEFKNYNSVKEILDFLDIEVITKEIKSKTVQSQLLITEDGYASIFVSASIEDKNYINFLLAHELGHYVLHYDTDVSFSFISRIYKTRLEKEANLFACELLMCNENIKQQENIEFIVKEKGIPLKVWYSVVENIKNDFEQEEL